MKKVLLFLIVLNSAVMAGNSEANRTEEALRKAMEQEKKFAEEQKFYNAENYDFKGAEVDPESLKSIPVIEPEYDFDMTHVYD